MSNVIAGVRLPANAVVLVRGHLERFSRARAEPEVHFIQAEMVGMLMMLEQLQRLSRPNAMTLARYVQGLADARVAALNVTLGEPLTGDTGPTTLSQMLVTAEPGCLAGCEQ